MPDLAQPATGAVSRFLLRVPVPWVFILVYLIGLGLQMLTPATPRWSEIRMLTPIGIAIFALGVLIAGWGWTLFHRAGTTRVPGQASTTLVTSGPYRFTRNPMYVGLSLAYLGEATILHHLWPAILFPLVVLYVNYIVIPLEESRLLEVFGSQYEQYRGRVRRWL